MKIRKPKIDYSSIKKYWFYNNSLTTYFMSSLMSSFPEGEKFFIKSVKEKNSNNKDIKKFIAQEIIHSKEHYKVFDEIEKSGMKIKSFIRLLNNVFFNYKFSIFNLQKYIFGKNINLSITSALEHITFCLAIFSSRLNLKKYVDEPITQMLRWHALEEIEHKNIAFDTLKENTNSYFLRILGMIIASIIISFISLYGTIHLTIINRDYIRAIKDIPFFFVMIIGILKYTIKNYLLYFKPSFHPSQIDDSKYRQKLESKIQKNL